MKKGISNEVKVGLLVAVALFVIGYITIDVSDLSLTPGGTYTLYTVMESAEGITSKTPIQVAGIPIGVVGSVDLLDSRRAKVGLQIKNGVELGNDVKVHVRKRGVLGDTYIEIIPGTADIGRLSGGDEIVSAEKIGDYQTLIESMNQVTSDLKEITGAIKTYTVSDESRAARILENMEILTGHLATISQHNANDIDAIVANLREITGDVRSVSGSSSKDVQETLARIARITGNIENSQGSLGKLINESTTIDKTNEVLDNVSDLTRTYFSMQTEVGWHMEYLGKASEVKNYVGLKIKPRPDKYFHLEVVHDKSPPASRSTVLTRETTGGVTTETTTETTKYDSLRFTAELGKKFDDLTVHAGLIESTGGVGVDYTKGPIDLKVSAYDFGDKPHMKFLTQLNMTDALFLVGGVDNFLGKEQDPDWFLGAGLHFTDEDIKSLFGGAALILSK